MTKKQPFGIPTPGQTGAAQVAPASYARLLAELARQSVHLYCAMGWPEDLHCTNCRAFFRVWGIVILRQAGWTDEQINEQAADNTQPPDPA